MESRKPLPLSLPFVAGNEQRYVQEAIASGRLAGDGPFTERVRAVLEHDLGGSTALLTTSCTSALELAALLLTPGPATASDDRDEVIVPSFTFVSTVNAFLIHGFRVVFCDVRADTGNADASTIAPLVGPRTRAIVPVHYAGVPCEMAPILALARTHNLAVVEDAAQALDATVDGKPAGALGDLGCFSFHNTKNIVCGEGGALIVNRKELVPRAEILREKGTNRAQFLMGHVDKYTWVDVGGSFLPSDMLAAFLLGQLEQRAVIADRRRALWERYHAGLADLEARGVLRRAVVPGNVRSNHHIFFIVVEGAVRERLMRALNAERIGAAFHYPALHLTPMGRRVHDGARLPVAEALGDGLLRLPLHCGMDADDVDRVVAALAQFFGATP